MADTPTLEANQNPPSSKVETNFRKDSMSRWMAGLKEGLPNPSLTGSVDEPETRPIEEPPNPAPENPPAQPNPPPAQPKPVTPPIEPPLTTAPPVVDEIKWPRSAKEWKNYTEKNKARNEEYEKKIAERDAEIKNLQSKVGLPVSPEAQKEIESLKKEAETYSHQLRLLQVTQHPKFKQYFEGKTNSTLAQLKSFIKPDQLEQVTKLVQMPDSQEKETQINELLVTMSPMQQGRLFNVIAGMDSIRAEYDSEVTRAQQDYEKMMAQAKTEKDQQLLQFNKTLDETIKSIQDPKSGRPEYQAREGELEWNNSVKSRIETAKQLITGNLSPEAMFQAAFDAAAYKDILGGYKAALGEIDKLKAQVQAMTAANPKIEPGAKRPETSTGTLPSMPKDARPMDFTKRWVEQFKQAMQGQ